MEFVNQGFTRLGELFKTLSPTVRLVAVLSPVVILASLAWLVGRQVAPGDTYLMAGESFSSADLRDMEGALGQAGLLDYEIEGTRIRVPHGQQAKYMAVLAEAGALPPDFGEYLRKAVDDSGFMLSGSRQEAQLKVAVQRELQGVINHFQGIERSFVQIAEEVNQGFPRTKTVTASVGVQPSTTQPVDERTVSAIRCIVAGAWGGLKPENVTVVDLKSRRLFSGPLASPATGDYAETKKRLELDWQEKLARVLGIPGAIVTANVELTADGRVPRSVSVAVAVPQAHFAAIWERRHGSPSGRRAARPEPAAFAALEQAERQRIKEAISPLLNSGDRTIDPASLVAVSTIYAANPRSTAEPSYEALAAGWLVANWQNIAFGGLVVVAILLLRSTFRTARPAQPPLPADLDTQPLYLVTPDDSPRVPAKSAAPVASGIRHDELAARIRRDPQAAATVLKSWIGNAS